MRARERESEIACGSVRLTRTKRSCSQVAFTLVVLIDQHQRSVENEVNHITDHSTPPAWLPTSVVPIQSSFCLATKIEPKVYLLFDIQ